MLCRWDPPAGRIIDRLPSAVTIRYSICYQVILCPSAERNQRATGRSACCDIPGVEPRRKDRRSSSSLAKSIQHDHRRSSKRYSAHSKLTPYVRLADRAAASRGTRRASRPSICPDKDNEQPNFIVDRASRAGNRRTNSGTDVELGRWTTFRKISMDALEDETLSDSLLGIQAT